jgi:hypothetical protein
MELVVTLRRQRITVESMARDALALAELMQKYGYEYQARILEEATVFATTEPQTFLDHMSSGGVWGSAGSVLDVIFDESTGQSSETVRADRRTHLELLLKLAQGLSQNGDPSGRAVEHAAIVRTLLSSKYFSNFR